MYSTYTQTPHAVSPLDVSSGDVCVAVPGCSFHPSIATDSHGVQLTLASWWSLPSAFVLTVLT